MILAHKIALDPTVRQRIALAKACGVARFTWNWALAEWDKQYKAGKKTSPNILKKRWNRIKKKKFPWVYESPKDANQQPFANLGDAFHRFFSKTSGHPVFKKKGGRDSFYASNDKFAIKGKRIRLPVVGEVRMREALRFNGKTMSATVSRQANRWFVSISVDVGDVKKERNGNDEVGIDLGLKHALVCSNGQVFDAPKPLKKNLKRLQRKSRQHSRKQKGSNNRKKSQRRLARLHARIQRIRYDWQHKVTTKIARENQTVCLEDLNVKGMMANRRLSRALSDVGFAEIRRQLEYKTNMHGGKVIVIDRWFPSSKKCSRCGAVKDSIALNERVFHCDRCGFEIDRDLNAARNICTVGLTGTYACGPEGAGDRREATAKPCRVEAGTTPWAHSHALTK
jgi:putative transposase